MKTLAIIAGGNTKAYFNRETHKNDEIWTLPVSVPEFNSIATRCFELHTYATYKRLGDRQLFLKDLKDINCPLYLQETHKNYPNSVRYPIEYILGKYRRFFDGTISYLMVMAIDEGFEEIYLYGADLNEGDYKKQRPSLEYWIGHAEGAGIKVHVYDGSALQQRPELYGYDWPLAVGEVSYTERIKRQAEKDKQMIEEIAS